MKEIIEEASRLSNYQNEHDGTVPRVYREIEEKEVAECFAKWYREHRGIELTRVRNNPCDPPDCVAERNGQEIGIEVTELVDQQVREELIGHVVAKTSETGKSMSEWPRRDIADIGGYEFNQSLRHNPELLVKILRYRIAKKDETLKDCAENMDVFLVIFFRDRWLEKGFMTQLLSGRQFDAVNIHGVFLRGSFEDDYPIWELTMNDRL